MQEISIKEPLLPVLNKENLISALYNKLGYDAITIGHHDFEFGPTDPKKNVADLHEDPQGQLKKKYLFA